MGLAIFPILLLFALPLLVMLVLAVVRACTLPRRVGKRPSCGACGYEYTGWTVCPECGGEVMKVGVLTSRLALKLRGSAAMAAVALVILVGVGAFVVGGVGAAVFETMGYATRNEMFQLVPQPSSGLFTNYSIDVHTELEYGRGGKVRWGTIVLVPNKTGQLSPVFAPSSPSYLTIGNAHARISAATGACGLYDAKGGLLKSSARFGSDEAHEVFALGGFPAPNEDQERSIEATVKVVSTILSSNSWMPGAGVPMTPGGQPGALRLGSNAVRTGPGGPVRFLSLSSTASWYLLVAVGACVTYVLLFGYVLRRRRRLMNA